MWSNEACLCRLAGGRRLQTCWTVANRVKARPRELVEHVALFVKNMFRPAQVHLQTVGFCHAQERKQPALTANRCFAARRLPQRARRCGTARRAAVLCVVHLPDSHASSTTNRSQRQTAWLIRKCGLYPAGRIGFDWRSGGTYFALILRYSKNPQCSTKNRQMRPRRRRQCWKSVRPPQNG